MSEKKTRPERTPNKLESLLPIIVLLTLMILDRCRYRTCRRGHVLYPADERCNAARSKDEPQFRQRFLHRRGTA